MAILSLSDPSFGGYGRVFSEKSDPDSYNKEFLIYPDKNEFFRTDKELVLFPCESPSTLYLKQRTESKLVCFDLSEPIVLKPSMWFHIETSNPILKLLSPIELNEQSFKKKYFSLYNGTAMLCHSSATLQNMENTIEAAEAIISEKLYDMDLGVGHIARRLNVSSSYLYRCSVRRYGMGLSQYICEKKLVIAEQLLSEGSLSSTEIAGKLNFCSQSYFSLQFKKKYGLPPLAYRKECIKNRK
ncbi:MAG: helix-turn-helix transcriptional regulator [Clostridia bacterium]|nr:helix-turn-helix transcriptional regulator [Clostridia bacterium]